MKYLLYTSVDWKIREPRNSHNYIRLTREDVEILLSNMKDGDKAVIYTGITKYD